MLFILLYTLISCLCIAVSAQAFWFDGDLAVWGNLIMCIILIYAWFSPIFIWLLQPKNLISARLYTFFAQSGYFLYGTAFLLTICVVLYDILWSGGYLLGNQQIRHLLNPENMRGVKYLILAVVLVSSLYSVYAVLKQPRVRRYEYHSSAIRRPLTMLVVSDMHITKMTSLKKIDQWISLFNDLNPDVVVMPGDIADDCVDHIREKIRRLKKIKAPLGVFFALGNHEMYFDPFAWEAEFASLGWQILHNSGVKINDTGIFIGGVPNIGRDPDQIKRIFNQAENGCFRILLSHEPMSAAHLTENDVDLQISGHTHGGQIFPFHFLVKLGNKGMLAGKYERHHTQILVSRGVGYWGPPMRLFAPAEVLLINFRPK